MTCDGLKNKPGPDALVDVNDLVVNAEDLGDVELYLNREKTNITKIERDYVVQPFDTVSYVFKISAIVDVNRYEIDYIKLETLKIYVQYQSSSFSQSYTDVITVIE